MRRVILLLSVVELGLLSEVGGAATVGGTLCQY